MPETHPDYVTDPDPAGVVVLSGVILCVLIAAVAALVMTLSGPEIATDPHPDPAPPSPSSSAWSEECTAEDLEDGMCLTYDDIRNQPTYSQGPNGPVLVK